MEVREEDEDINSLLHLTTDSNALWIYLILFGSAVIENLFPPFPGDTIILGGGYLVGVGRLHFLGALLSTAAGSLGGASLLYLLGLTKGRPFFQRGKHPFFSPERLQRVEGWFERHGEKVVLVSRFLAGVRSLVAICAGIGRMRYGMFLAFSLVSISVWNSFLLFLGLGLGQNWERVARLFRFYNGLIVVVVVLFVLFWYLKRRRHPKFWIW